jgi:hypothetical protein
MIMRTGRSVIAVAVAGALAGLASLAVAPSARAAVDPAVLEAIESPEVVEVARQIAALLEDAGPDAEAPSIAAELHGLLANGAYSAEVVESALAVVLGGDWSETQLAALRTVHYDYLAILTSTHSEYAPDDLKAPSGGGEAEAPLNTEEPVETAGGGSGSENAGATEQAGAAMTVEPVPPSAAEPDPVILAASTDAPLVAEQPETPSGDMSTTAPPPSSTARGGSDYRP